MTRTVTCTNSYGNHCPLDKKPKEVRNCCHIKYMGEWEPVSGSTSRFCEHSYLSRFLSASALWNAAQASSARCYAAQGYTNRRCLVHRSARSSSVTPSAPLSRCASPRCASPPRCARSTVAGLSPTGRAAPRTVARIISRATFAARPGKAIASTSDIAMPRSVRSGEEYAVIVCESRSR